jgi:hypothetical protein
MQAPPVYDPSSSSFTAPLTRIVSIPTFTPTRWDSLFLCMKRIVRLQKALRQFAADFVNRPLSDARRKLANIIDELLPSMPVLEVLCHLLAPLTTFSHVVCSEGVTSSEVLFRVKTSLIIFDDVVKTPTTTWPAAAVAMASRLRASFIQRFGGVNDLPLHFVLATALDIRYKTLGFLEYVAFLLSPLSLSIYILLCQLVSCVCVFLL